ncbi:hypothetical protein TNCV_3826821 [Trichonephila clavipes]|nr:hypothetical protein TNCV_3826821 [Trichonephila clavipes]
MSRLGRQSEARPPQASWYSFSDPLQWLVRGEFSFDVCSLRRFKASLVLPLWGSGASALLASRYILLVGGKRIPRGVECCGRGPGDIWILTDSRASKQHLSHWTNNGGMTSLNILDVVVRLSSRHFIYFQWVPSHIGLNGNEMTKLRVKSATTDILRGDACLTFAE